MARGDSPREGASTRATITALKRAMDEARISTLSPEDRLGYELGDRIIDIWHEYGRRDGAKYLDPAHRIQAVLRFVAAAVVPMGRSSEEHITALLLLGLSGEIKRAYVTLRKMRGEGEGDDHDS